MIRLTPQIDGHVTLLLTPAATMEFVPPPPADPPLYGSRRGALGWMVTAGKVTLNLWRWGLLGGHQMVRRRIGCTPRPA